jgi:DeoR/GlpR family transcriptional regulator of sugar metabolism
MEHSMNSRQQAILTVVAQSQKTDVASLAERFGVSQVTIRQDLRALEDAGRIRRYHGGAMPLSQDDMNSRLAINYEVKLAIAREAASLVDNGESVLIESGSTNVLLAMALAEKRGVTIITNSVFICRQLRGMHSVKVVLLGGDYQHESEVLVGPLTRKSLQSFHVDKLFVGSDGFSPDMGFTCNDLQRAEVARAMAERANKIIVVTDSSKFNQQGVASQFSAEEVDIVITDHNLSLAQQDSLGRFSIAVKMV